MEGRDVPFCVFAMKGKGLNAPSPRVLFEGTGKSPFLWEGEGGGGVVKEGGRNGGPLPFLGVGDKGGGSPPTVFL